MALEKIRPRVVDETQNYVFNNVTATGNLTTLNANLGNLAVANYITGVLTTAAQPNITSVGTLGNITITSNVTAGNIKTDNLLYANGSAWAFATVSGSNTQVQFNNSGAFGSSANFTFDSTTNTLSADSFVGSGSGLSNITGSNVTGQVPNSSIAGTVYTNAQPNITSVGTLTSVTISGNVTSGNADLGNLASANYFSGSGNLLSNIVGANITGQVGYAAVANSVAGSNITGAVTYAATANAVAGANVLGAVTYAATANAVDGANVSGTVANATYAITAGTSYSVAAANITGTINLANFATTANSVAVANVSGIGNIAVVNKDGNASNILYGNGVFAAPAAGSSYGDSNVASYLPNYTGNLTPGHISIDVANIAISGGTANYVLQTDGAGNLLWAAQAAGSGSSGGESTVTSVDTFTGDGTETVFTLSVAPQSINQTFINYNGALQLRSAYTISGQDITFSEAPANGSIIEVTTQMGVTSGSGSLTVRNYTADGVQTAYTVSAGVNATNILVTENGLLQTPVADYTVTGSTLTFIAAPGYNVKIQIRELGVAVATITPAGSNTQVLFNNAGSFGHSSAFTFNNTSNTLSVNNINVTGNIVPTANVTYNLGNSTNRFKDLFLSGNTIDLGGAQIKTDSTSGAIAFVPPATVAEPNPTALVISSTGGISTAVTTNGVLTSNAITVAAATGTLSSPRYITMHTTGNISASTGTSRYYPPGNVNINNVSASLSTAPTANMTFQLCKNGSNVGAYTIEANSYILIKTSANISLSTSDYLTVNIVSGDGNDLRMDLQYVAA